MAESAVAEPAACESTACEPAAREPTASECEPTASTSAAGAILFCPAGRAGWWAALVTMALVLPAAIWQWDFFVDDALISARYASQLAAGNGYHLNAVGGPSDGVTPLGWAWVLAPFASSGPLAALKAAKWLGLLAWLGGAGALGTTIAGLGQRRARWGALLLLATSAPLAAWSVAGMETGVVLGLAAAATVLRVQNKHLATGLVAGWVALWRPEALLWALLLSAAPGAVASTEEDRVGRIKAVLLALTPFALGALLRLALFGAAYPLSAVAKAPVLSLGVRYAVSVGLLGGPLAALAILKVPHWVRGLQLAIAGHLVSLALVGGDWMPLSRLLVVALPAVCLCCAALLQRGRAPLSWALLAAALAGQLYVAVKVAPAAARQWPRRLAVIEQLRAPLADAEVVAALDIGWLGAACDAEVVDLAGVTDRGIAVLPGGHTSKRIPDYLLQRRGVDTLVLLLANGEQMAAVWTESRFARQVEYRLSQQPAMAERFEVVAQSAPPLVYLVLRRRVLGN